MYRNKYRNNERNISRVHLERGEGGVGAFNPVCYSVYKLICIHICRLFTKFRFNGNFRLVSLTL